ncbi:MAG: hypothetical protein ABI599_08375 [Flavobacteriales bacterium]
MKSRYTLFTTLLLCVAVAPLSAQLTILTQFDPSNTGGTCGIAYNSTAGEVLVIGCFGATIDRYDQSGAFISSAPIAGESANDVDVDMSPVAFVMNGTAVAQGQLLFMNGETDETEIYAIDEATGVVIDTLPTQYGVSHVVGGSYHPLRNTFFMVQDNVPGSVIGNRIAEIDPNTGDTLQTFSVLPNFDVNYGDLDISPISGNLFVVSSSDAGVAEFTPDGVFVQNHALPVGVSSLSGIALDNDLQGAWVCNTSGVVFKLGNFPIGISEELAADPIIQVFPNPAKDRVEFVVDVDRPGKYSIVLHDVAGRVAQSLFDGALPAGSRRIAVDVGTLGVGCYSVLVAGPGISVTRRLMVVR